MKKLLSVILSTLMILSATGCNNTPSAPDSIGSESTVQQENTENCSYRVFDSNDPSAICDKILPMFAIAANTGWHKEDSAPLLEAVGTNVFKYLVESLYTADTGKEFDSKNGRISVDSYVEYGTKYFDFYAEDIKSALTDCSTYNAADNTVLMHDGLGCVTGVKVIAVTPVDNMYVIDYAVSYPEDAQLKYAYMVFSVNDDGSYKFISNSFTDTVYNPSYDLNNYYYADDAQIVTSRDERYDLYKAYTLNFGLKYREIRLKDKENGYIKSLGFIVDNQVSDAGFFSNGDVYTMDYSGLYVHSTDMTSHEAVFCTKTNFNAGSFIDYGGKERYIFSIRRDPENFDYIVIYGEYEEDADYNTAHPNNFQLAYNYKIGLLDKDGNLTQSWDTGVPIMYSAYGFESVFMYKTSENEIEFLAIYKNNEHFRARFDLTTGVCTILKSFDVPADQQFETVKQLADQWVSTLNVWLGSDWDSNTENTDFGLHIALMNLYCKDKGLDFPTTTAKQPNGYAASEAVRVSDLVPVAEKYFDFDTYKLYDYYRNLSVYDAYNDSIILGDGWGWPYYVKVNGVSADENGKYKIYYDLVNPEDTVEYSKVLTVALKDNSYLQYISNCEISDIMVGFDKEEKMLLNANILSEYLPLCLNVKSTPENPEFSFGHFLIRCAIETQNDFCYYNLFYRANENSGDYSFEYNTVKKVLKQVFNDDHWADYWFNKADLSGISHTKENNTITMATETGAVWSYYADDFIYSEFSADNTQIISHFELFAPDASSGDPGSKSIGNYKIVYDVCTENGETFLRFNRFEKAADDNKLNTELTSDDINFDNSEVIADIKSVYSSAPYNGVEELEFLKYSKGEYSFRVWRVFDKTDEDIYWLICRFKSDRLIGFIRGQFTGLKDFYSLRINDFYTDHSEKIFEFFTSDDLSLVKIRSSGISPVFSFEFYHNSMSIQDYKNASQPFEPDEYVNAEIQDFYNTVKIFTGKISETNRKKYEDLIYSHINNGTIELDPDYGNNKKYKDYYSAEVINCYEDDSILLINYVMRCAETSLGLVQTTLFEKNGSNPVYYGSSRILSHCCAQNNDKTMAIYSGGSFDRGFEQEIFLYDNINGTSQNLGLVHNTGYTFDAGFMSNGDVYIMNYEEFRTYSVKDNTAVQSFTTRTNFPAGGVIKSDETKRYLFTVRRDPEKFDYVVIYGEYIEDGDYNVTHPNNAQLAYNYKVGLLDKDGKLTQSWDTGVPIMFNAFGFNEVSMFKSGKNEIEFFVTFKNKDNELLRGKFNIKTGIYTPIKEFKLS